MEYFRWSLSRQEDNKPENNKDLYKINKTVLCYLLAIFLKNYLNLLFIKEKKKNFITPRVD